VWGACFNAVVDQSGLQDSQRYVEGAEVGYVCVRKSLGVLFAYLSMKESRKEWGLSSLFFILGTCE